MLHFLFGHTPRFRDLVLAALSLVAIGCAPPTVFTRGVPNLHQLAPNVWRGGEPTEEGWRFLVEELHVCEVVQLDYDREGPRVEPPQVVRVHKIGMPPSGFRDALEGPSNELVNEAVSTLAAPSTCARYLHCLHGHDRTGLVAAAYRVAEQGWPPEKAWREAIGLGLHPELLGLVSAWQRFVGDDRIQFFARRRR